MKKRLLSILLLLTMLFTLLPAEAMAVVADNINTAVNTAQEKKNLENPFTDIREGSWYYDAVQYARVNGFFSGTSANTFAPDGTMSRGMFVTVLGRMAGVDQSAYQGQSTFDDVAENAYYAPFVAWASKHGITAGVGKNKFDPNGLINREQMAAFFVRYFETFGVNYDTDANITTVPADLETVSPWARDMVLKLWKTGLLSGDGISFNPRGNASRAQAATLCMRTDQAVETWYREPGVPSDRVSIDPGTEQTPEPSKPSTGGSSGGSGGESNTTYYNVTFVVDAAEDKRLYQKDTLLSTLPTPAQPTGKVFLGWYHDAEKSKPVSGDDRLTANTTLYAKFTDTAALSEGGAPNFASALDQAPSFSIAVQSDTQPILGTDFKFRNITAPDKTPEGTVATEDTANVETVKVEGSGGVWKVSSKNGGFTPGHTYQIELLKDSVTYQDSTVEVRFFNFSIMQDGTLNLKLNDDIKYIGVNELNAADGASLMEYAGLYLASTDGQGLTTYTANDGSGSFTYDGDDIQVGDTVSVYAGDKPTERKPEKGTAGKTNNGDVSYVKITAIDGSTYHYVAAEAEDVLFTPDVLPIDLDYGDGTNGWAENGNSVTVESSKLDFSSGFESMGLSAETTVDVGDYLAFYTGDFGEDGAQDKAYGEIISITVSGDATILTYSAATEEQVMSAMDMYDETQLTEEELQAAIDENQGEIQRIIEAQLMESDFFDDAGEYLAGLALQTDEVKERLGDGLTMSDCTITYADGTPLGADDLALMGNIIDKDQDGKKPKASVSISPRLSHFDGKGLRVEVAVSYTFQIQKSGSDTIMEVNLTAFFEQEVIIGFSVSGGAVWKWKWIFPYISDFRMNGNLDLGTYTGIGITATAKLTQDEEPWGMLWPDEDYEQAIVNIGESIKKKMEEVETVLPEAEATAGGGLAEKYAEFMAGANEDWVDLITVKLLDISGAVDPFHILAYGLQVDFVVSANLNVALGMTFQYENFKRHSFTLSLKSKKADSDTVDLSTNGYQFDFYVMGTIGLRAGIRAKATVGLFSTKLAGIGLQIEAGAYTRMWGYFYYHLDNWKIDGKWEKNSGSSGAALIEIGAYLDVKFIAEALNGKYQYAPTIYAKEWPFWSAGRRENVYDFAYADNPTYAILNVTTYTLPSAAYDMLWMDLKTGETGTDDDKNTKNFDGDTAVDGDDEAHFAVELSNPNFTYNPVDNTVSVSTASGALEQSCEMVITWKGAPLSGSTETLSRTVTLNWSNDANAGTIAFESNGGSAAQMLRMLAGTSLSGGMPASPTKLGYTFAGWYTDTQLSTSFTATTMPEGNTTLYAKWTPKIVSHTEEHYQKALSGRYVLTDTTSKTGETDSQTTSVAKTYTGFTAQPIEQQTIAPDGSTRVSIYYDRVSYPLTFAYGTGGSEVTVSTPYGATIVKPSNPSKQGYLFSGWNPAAIPDTMPANPLTFTAQWAEKTDTPYTVKHYKQNLDGTYALEQTEGKFGTTGETTAAEARTYTGFTAQTITQKSIAPDGRTVVEIQYARNSHSLTWNVNGGNDLAGNYTNGSTKYGTAIVKPDNPTRAGYIFGGWYQDSELTTALENNASMPDVPLTLYAKWTAKGDTPYTVKHVRQALDDSYPENNGLVETAAMTGTTGQNTAAVAKSYTGFNVQDFEQTTIAADGSTVVEIRYKRNSYALTWDVNGGSTLTGDYTSGDTKYGTAILIPTPTRAGYNFMGWYKDAELTTALVEATMPDHALTLTAKWDLIPEGGYAVKHIRQDLDGSYPESGGLVETETLTGLKGQSTEAKAKTYEGFTTQNITQQTIPLDGSTVVVEIRYARNSHSLTWDVNGGGTLSGTYPRGDTKYGAAITKPDTPTYTGHTFGGWYTDAGLTTVLEDNATMPNAALTLYAKWTQNTYTVAFDSNQGSGSSTPTTAANLSRTHGEAYGTLPTVSRDGYAFNGWFTAASGGTAVVGTGTAEASHTLYAHWTANSYTVVFDKNGGEGSMTNQSFTYDAAKNLTANAFTKTGYTFSGWNTAANGSGTSYATGASVFNLTAAANGTVTLYAQWMPVTYAVDFDSNGGSNVANISVTYGSAYGTLPAVTRPGYTFNGWYTAKSDGTKVEDATTVTTAANHTLYAQWTANRYTVAFDSNGGSGTMDNQNFTYDEVQSLSSNAFTRTGYTFSGWKTTASGEGTLYADEGQVSNLTNVVNGTVTLYAQWEAGVSAAQIGETKYAALQEAINEVQVNGTILLLNDLTEQVTIPDTNSKSFTLDLNGKTFSGGTGTAITHNGSGKLTITDSVDGSGKVTGTNTSDVVATTAGTIRLGNTAAGTVLEIAGGTVVAEPGRLKIGSAIYNNGAGNVAVSGGTVSVASESGGSAIYNADSGNVTISGGTVSMETYGGGSVIANYGSGNVTVSGGEVNLSGNSGNAIYNQAGDVIISGGKVNVSTALQGSGVAIQAGSVTMTDGTIDVTQGYALFNFNVGKIEVSGGKLESGGTAIRGAGGTITISGDAHIIGKSAYVDPYATSGAISLSNVDNVMGSLQITGGTIENPSEDGCAIILFYPYATVQITGSATIRGNSMAIKGGTPSLSGVSVTASVDYDGTNQGAYNPENIATYKYLSFTK